MHEITESFTTPELDGVALRILRWGHPGAPTLVLLHGGGANAHWWSHLAPALAESFAVVALDFRGHGSSDYPDDLVVGAFNLDLEALLEHLGTEAVVLVGHSMGGHVALDHAARHPATRALILLDIVRGAGRRSRRSARLALTFRRTYRTHEEAVRRYRFFPPAPHATEALRAAIAEHSVRRESDGRFGYAFDPRWFGVPARPRPDLSAVLCPTLLVRGEESELLTSEGAVSIVDELPRGRTCAIAGAGHQVHIDQPQDVLVALDEFLGDVLPGGVAPSGGREP